jgi:hypothetical protein
MQTQPDSVFDYEDYLPEGTTARWKPLTHGDPENNPTSQEAALDSRANEIMLTGGRGWGKTDIQLVRFAQNVGIGYGSYWRGIIFDREYKNLDDLVVKSRRLFEGSGAQFMESSAHYKWVWPTGEELLFRVAKKESDYWSFHGHEYPFIGWNELTKYPDHKLYERMLSTNRSGFDPETHTPKIKSEHEGHRLSFQYRAELNGKILRPGDYATPDGLPLPSVPLEVVSTTNPWGPGHHWVKAQFITPAPYGKTIRIERMIFNPKTRMTENIVRRRVTFFGTFRENPFLSPEYIAGLYLNSNENMIKAWLNGDWDIVAGGAFDDVWDSSIHVVPRFKVPSGWHLDRTFDWGSTHPFSVGLWAEANGEEAVLPDGSTFCPSPGSIIQFAEIYGSKEIGSNTGLQMSPADVAKEIKALEAKLSEDGWCAGFIYPGPADNQISNVTRIDIDTIEKTMQDNGIYWTNSDKSNGSRKNGFELMRGRMLNAKRGEGAGIYFMDNCRASVSTIPVLPRDEKDPDDIDTSAEDHPYDMARYRVLSGNNRTATSINVTFPK